MDNNKINVKLQTTSDDTGLTKSFVSFRNPEFIDFINKLFKTKNYEVITNISISAEGITSSFKYKE